MTPDRFEDVYGTDEDARLRALEELSGGQSMAGVLSKLRTRRQAMEAPTVDVSQVPVSEGLPLRTHEQLATPRRAEEAPAARRMPRDTALDEAFAADAERSQWRSIARAGSKIGAALAGVPFDAQAWEERDKSAPSQVKELLAKRAAAVEAAKTAQTSMLADPNSPASIRMRATIKAALPNVPDAVLSGITAADAGSIFEKLKEGAKLSSESEARRLARQESAQRFTAEMDARRMEREAAERHFAAQLAETRASRLASADLQRELAKMGAKERAALKEEERTKGTIIPGLEAVPGAQPTAEDAKKVKASIAARERVNANVDELMKLYNEHGTEMTGPVAVRMGQLITAIKLEGKNLAELGALSGPDVNLMESIVGVDPTSFMSNIKGMAGMDTTRQAMEGVRKWAGTQAGANVKAYGYQPKGGAPKPDIDLTQPTGRRVTMPDGSVWEELPDGSARQVK